MIPTPIEYVKLLLFLMNYMHDFTEIIIHAADYCFTGLALYDTAIMFSPSTISLAALILTFEDLDYLAFKKQVKSEIVEHGLGYDFEEADACQQMIVTYMHQLEDDDEQQQSDQQRFDGRETANSQESEAGAQTNIMTQTEELVSPSI
jgi:hypothetical protein